MLNVLLLRPKKDYLLRLSFTDSTPVCYDDDDDEIYI